MMKLNIILVLLMQLLCVLAQEPRLATDYKATRDAIERARTLRKAMSLPEVLLWVQLKQRPGGFKFRKQVPAEPYTLDFACLSARLAIEIDGEAHNRGDQPRRDEVRDRVMAQRGFRTLRLPAHDVLNNMDGCIATIVEACTNPPGNGEVARSDGGVGSLPSSAGLAGSAPTPPPPLRGGPPPRAGDVL